MFSFWLHTAVLAIILTGFYNREDL